MEYLLTMKDGAQTLSQEVGTNIGTLKLVKQVLMAMSNLTDQEADMHTIAFLQQVEEVGAQAIQNKDTGHKLIVQVNKEEADGDRN